MVVDESRLAVGDQASAEGVIEPFLLSVLSARLSAIVREMNSTLMRTSRSSLIKNSRDFSCGLLTYNHRLLTVEDCIPIHIAGLNLATEPLTELFDDIKPGDAFLNNSPFYGNTHHADMTLCVPVFAGSEPLFWTLSRAHHADIGAPIPSTYLPEAKNVFQEGIHLPCIRIQENGQDKPDLIRMVQTKNRVPDLWYGDYQAQVAACRVGERRLIDLVNRYGIDTVKLFVEEWLRYGERRMSAEIASLPSGSWEFDTRHDPVPGIADEGIPVHVRLEIDAKEALITVDVRDNVDCIPGGLNLTEATALASCRIGVFNNLDPTLPHNEGSASRIKVLLRDGCVVGRPVHPMGTSMATTNVASRLINAVGACFAQVGASTGMAEIAYSQSIGEAVISGTDPERGGMAYVNQVFLGYGGSGALSGYDGWMLSGAGVDGGQMALDSVEVDESMYPILVEERKVACDSGGVGTWEGAPGIFGVYRSLYGEMTAFFGSDGDVNPPRGVRGGGDAAQSCNWRKDQDGELVKLSPFDSVVVGPSEGIAFRSCGGGGYGDPALRDSALVLLSLERGWISIERARSVYGVEVEIDTDSGRWRLRDGESLTAEAM
jgi:N-methylhydantoinase B